MKKYFLLFLLLCGISSIAYANPIDGTPKVEFAKLSFDANNNWAIKIHFPFNSGDINRTAIDSIIFIASNISSKFIGSYPDTDFYGIVTSDSLSIPLNINREGDKIIINTYSHSAGYINLRQDSIIFGNYPGATVAAPINGYSIVRVKTYLYTGLYITIDCLSNYSLIDGFDSLSTLGSIMKGHIYDINNKILRNYVFPGGPNSVEGKFILETNLTVDSTGTFTTYVFNTSFKPEIIYVNVGNYQYASGGLRIKPIELDSIVPGAIIYHDIYLTDTCKYCNIITSISNSEQQKNVELTIINYPNPFNLTTNFYVKVPDRLKGKTGFIKIYNVTGQLIRSIEYKNQSTVSWDARDESGKIMPSGVYYYRLSIDKQLLKTGSMILLK